MQRTSLAALVLTGALFLGACAVDSATEPEQDGTDIGGAVIEVTNQEFTPEILETEAGETVVWQFQQGSHNVVFEDVESDVLSSGTFERTFDQPGTYDYECTLHNGMTGQVLVHESA